MASFESLQATDRPRSDHWPRREVLLMSPAEWNNFSYTVCNLTTRLETFCLQSKAGWDVYSLKAAFKKKKGGKKGMQDLLIIKT